MIPQRAEKAVEAFTFAAPPSGTFRLDTEAQALRDRVDGREAVKQAIYIMLNVERYRHLIHSWDFGVELEDLLGKPADYVQPAFQQRVTEALTQDGRINGVRDFRFEKAGKALRARFTVETCFGDVEAEKEITAGPITAL